MAFRASRRPRSRWRTVREQDETPYRQTGETGQLRRLGYAHRQATRLTRAVEPHGSPHKEIRERNRPPQADSRNPVSGLRKFPVFPCGSVAEQTMTSRERVLKAVNHGEADRVPIDLAGTLMSGIMASAYGRLKKHLGLDAKPPWVYELYQMLAEVEEPVLKRLRCDVVPLDPLTGFFDGTVVEAPGDFRAAVDPATGDLLLPPGGDTTRPPMGRMPKGGFYFDMIGSTQSSADFKPPAIGDYKRGLKPISDEEPDHLRKRAEHLHHHTDYAVLGGEHGPGTAEGGLRAANHLLGRRGGHAEDAALRHARRGARRGRRAHPRLRPRRRLRLQRGPQHPARHAAREYRGRV